MAIIKWLLFESHLLGECRFRSAAARWAHALHVVGGTFGTCKAVFAFIRFDAWVVFQQVERIFVGTNSFVQVKILFLEQQLGIMCMRY